MMMQCDVIPRTSLHPHAKGLSGYEPIDSFTTAAHTQLPDNRVEATAGARRGHGSKPSLLIAMIQAFGIPFAAAGFLWLISNILTFVGPLVLK